MRLLDLVPRRNWCSLALAGSLLAPLAAPAPQDVRAEPVMRTLHRPWLTDLDSAVDEAHSPEGDRPLLIVFR